MKGTIEKPKPKQEANKLKWQLAEDGNCHHLRI